MGEILVTKEANTAADQLIAPPAGFELCSSVQADAGWPTTTDVQARDSACLVQAFSDARQAIQSARGRTYAGHVILAQFKVDGGETMTATRFDIAPNGTSTSQVLTCKPVGQAWRLSLDGAGDDTGNPFCTF